MKKKQPKIMHLTVAIAFVFVLIITVCAVCWYAAQK